MNVRTVLSLSLLAAGLVLAGCSGPGGAPASPSSPSALQNAGSSASDTRPPQPPRPDPPPSTGTCIESRAQWAVGQPASASLLERARVDATAAVARFIRPNEPITMEYSPARLNLYLDGRDVVHSAICG